MVNEIDETTNKHFVGLQGDEIVVLRPPTRLSRQDALLLAAWLVALAEQEDGEQEQTERKYRP